jgi:Tol biopolymer transport system component
MRSYPSIIPFLLRLATLLTLFCLLLIGVAAFAGNTIRGTTISLILADQKLSPQGYGLLHLMDIRVGLTKQIFDLPVSCCPIWSPDGTQIAFRGENGQPMTWDMRDGTTHTLRGQDFNLSHMSWSPDSQELVFSVRDNASGKYTLYRAKADGSALTLFVSLLETDFYQADWSPDGRYIVFSARGGTIYRLYRVNADGTKLRQLKTSSGYNLAPNVSPDGQTVAFTSGERNATNLFIMDISGNNIRQLTFSDNYGKIPIWSPDGSKILFLTDINNNSSRVIDIINADGSEPQRLVDTHTSFDDSPSWSPDGTQILYEIQPQLGGAGAALYVMNSDGSNVRLLLEDSLVISLESSWQPQP